ncbi:hypothetical protein D3C81_2287670 [compost metagenome]
MNGTQQRANLFRPRYTANLLADLIPLGVIPDLGPGGDFVIQRRNFGTSCADLRPMQ